MKVGVLEEILKMETKEAADKLVNARRDLEREIEDSIREFEEATGLAVTELHVRSTEGTAEVSARITI